MATEPPIYKALWKNSQEMNTHLHVLLGEARELLAATILSPMYASLKERIEALLYKLNEALGKEGGKMNEDYYDDEIRNRMNNGTDNPNVDTKNDIYAITPIGLSRIDDIGVEICPYCHNYQVVGAYFDPEENSYIFVCFYCGGQWWWGGYELNRMIEELKKPQP